MDGYYSNCRLGTVAEAIAAVRAVPERIPEVLGADRRVIASDRSRPGVIRYAQPGSQPLILGDRKWPRGVVIATDRADLDAFIAGVAGA